MRIYSNTNLSWPQTLHIFQVARLYPQKWLHYNFYKIKQTQPLIISTNSPIELLENNYQYYCYDKYYRDKRLEKYRNTYELCSIINKTPEFNLESYIYIPKTIIRNDMIVIENSNNITGNIPYNPILS